MRKMLSIILSLFLFFSFCSCEKQEENSGGGIPNMISFNAIFYDNNNSEIADFNCLTLDIKHLNLKSGETYKLVLIPNFTGSPDLILSDESVKFILNDGSCETDTLADITLSDQQDGYLTYKLTLNSNADFWFNISIGELNMAIKIISSQ